MENILDFSMAAMPWIIIGLLAAIFFAGNGVKNNGHKNNYGTEGMCIGMCFGSILSMLLESHQGIGLPLGMLIGLVIGRCIKKSKL